MHEALPPSPWIQRWSHLVPTGGSVLDVACGSGRHLRWFAQRGCRVTGVDRDAAALGPLHAIAEVVVADIEGALKKQNMTLQAGDAVMIHTGWGKLWAKDNARYVKSCPGIGVAAALWLASKDPMLLGADNWPVEVAPNPDKQLSLPVHQIALVVNGIHLLENLKLDELAAKNVHEFAFIMQPLKIQGGSGSTVAPIALR